MSASDEKVYYNVDGKLVDADGNLKGAPQSTVKLTVTYNVNGTERYADGTPVDGSPVDKMDIHAGSGAHGAIADNAMLGGQGPTPMSPGELAVASMNEIHDSGVLGLDEDDLSVEERDAEIARIKADLQQDHLDAQTGNADESAQDAATNRAARRRTKTDDESQATAAKNAGEAS